MPELELTFLGTGTSVGVPMLCCDCRTCTSEDPRDRRYRSSVLLEWGGNTVVIDSTPEFRLQLLRANVKKLDALVLTHNHADHIHGLDDIRPFCFASGNSIPLYGFSPCIDYVERHFDYIWHAKQQGGGLPKVTLNRVTDPFEVCGLEFVPIPIMHGKEKIYGYRFGDCAYISDVSEIPESSMRLLEGLGTLILDAVRYAPHSTHFHIDEAIRVAELVGARQTYFTHLNHDIHHATFAGECPEGMAPAYDGLRIGVEI